MLGLRVNHWDEMAKRWGGVCGDAMISRFDKLTDRESEILRFHDCAAWLVAEQISNYLTDYGIYLNKVTIFA